RLASWLSSDWPSVETRPYPFDTTKFVEQSIHEVYKTLYEAALLVLVVILVFLQDWRAMLIPATTVPVTIIGAFAAMVGFTINFSTLFAIVLAIGIVVDDAIVVVEGAVHNIEYASRGHRLRMELDVLSGEARRQSDVHRVRTGAAASLPRARRPVRKL